MRFTTKMPVANYIAIVSSAKLSTTISPCISGPSVKNQQTDNWNYLIAYECEQGQFKIAGSLYTDFYCTPNLPQKSILNKALLLKESK